MPIFSTEEFDYSKFNSTGNMALDYMERCENVPPSLWPKWFSPVAMTAGLAGIMFETRTPPGSAERDILDGLLGYVEIMASLDGIQLCVVEDAKVKRVFIYSQDLISKDSLKKSRFYSYQEVKRDDFK